MTFRRSVEGFARLAAVELRDSGWKGPLQSLENIFRCWMPQTLVTAENRLREIRRLLDQFPTVGWPLLLQYIDTDECVGEFNAKPRWRRQSLDYRDTQDVRECLDFCVQGGFQGGSQSRPSFVYRGLKSMTRG